MSSRRHLAKGRAVWPFVGIALLPILWSGIRDVRSATPLLLNYDFTTDLSGWETAGDVQQSSGFAVLSDDDTVIGTLHQSVMPGPGFFELTFNFVGAFSTVVPPGTLLDVAFASVYLGDTPFVSPEDTGSFDQVISLFDLDSSGLRNVISGAETTDTPDRPGWTSISLTFESTYDYITPFIEIVDQNTIDADSSLAVDDVVLEQVPDPASDDDGDAMTAGIERRLGFDPDDYASRFVLTLVDRRDGKDILRYSEVKSGLGAYVLKFKTEAGAPWMEVDRFEPTPAEEGPDFEIEVVNPTGRGIYQVFFDRGP